MVKNIERLTCNMEDNKKLQYAKQECLTQIKNLNIEFICKGFFKINRPFLAVVSQDKPFCIALFDC